MSPLLKPASKQYCFIIRKIIILVGISVKIDVLSDTELLSAVVSALPHPIFISNSEGEYLDVLGGSDQERFYAGKYLIGKYLSDFFNADMTAAFLEQSRKAIETGSPVNYVYMIPFESLPAFADKEGPSGDRWYEANIAPIKKNDEPVDMVVWSVNDITDRKLAIDQLQQQQEMLKVQANTDALTGLSNRRAFQAYVEQEIQRVEHYSIHELSVLVLDIDHFKKVNDAYGHSAGDEVLVSFARHLRKTQRSSDIVARVGGEEFIILLPEISYKQALVVAERIRSSVEGLSVNISEIASPVRFTLSIGVSHYILGEGSADAMLHRADLGLYTAKKEGRNKVCGRLSENLSLITKSAE